MTSIKIKNLFFNLQSPFFLLFGMFFVFFGFVSRLTTVDIDIFHEMALFKEAMILGYLPDHDLFSYIPTRNPVVHHEWGTGAILYLTIVYLGLGSGGLMFLKYSLTTSTVLLCYRFSISQGGNIFILSFLSGPISMLGFIGFTTMRAQIFTLFFLVVLFFIIEQDREGKKNVLWLLVPLFIFWINLHAGFISGIILFAIYIVERTISQFIDKQSIEKIGREFIRYAIIFSAVSISCLFNPYGMEYFPYIIEAITLDRSNLITEWQPLWLISKPQFYVFFLLNICVLYAISKKGFKNLPGILMVAATSYAALMHYRHLSIFALTFACYFPSFLNHTPIGDLITKTMKNRIKIVSFIFFILGAIGFLNCLENKFWLLRMPINTFQTGPNTPIYPVGAIEYLKQNQFKGHLMVPFMIGSYVSWKLYPAVKVSMDSRFEVAYSYQSVLDNEKFYAAIKDCFDVPLRYQTDALLIPKRSIIGHEMEHGTSTEPGLRLLKEWVRTYKDGEYFIYMHPDIADLYEVVDLGEETKVGKFP